MWDELLELFEGGDEVYFDDFDLVFRDLADFEQSFSDFAVYIVGVNDSLESVEIEPAFALAFVLIFETSLEEGAEILMSLVLKLVQHFHFISTVLVPFVELQLHHSNRT